MAAKLGSKRFFVGASKKKAKRKTTELVSIFKQECQTLKQIFMLKLINIKGLSQVGRINLVHQLNSVEGETYRLYCPAKCVAVWADRNGLVDGRWRQLVAIRLSHQ